MLLYAAEDALHVVRQRLEGICAAAALPLAGLDVQVITVPSLRLDLETDRNSLAETVATLRPRLLVLDPFVRLHRIDENASGDVAPLLAYLRELQRRYAVAVIIVHARERELGSPGMSAGGATGGSDFLPLRYCRTSNSAPAAPSIGAIVLNGPLGEIAISGQTFANSWNFRRNVMALEIL